MIEIHIKKSIHSYSGKTDLEIDLEIEKGKFISLFGKSGAGKTTLLRILAGLIVPDEGYIKVDGEYWFDKKSGINLVPQKRNIGFVFQDHSLFPNMTVKENLEFVSPNRKDKEWLAYLLEIMDMEVFASRKPDSLSGGQQQRAALARAIARKPSILLLDEPFSSLDPETRELLQLCLKRIHNKFDLTSIMVSHDRGEVFSLSDYVYELRFGKLLVQNQAGVSKYYLGKILDMDEDHKTCLLELENGKNKIIIEMKIESFKEISSFNKSLII